MADNMATEYKSTEGALTHEFSQALLDVSEMPLSRKPVKRKSGATISNQPKKARPTLDDTREVAVCLANTTAPDTPPHASSDEPSPASSSINKDNRVATVRPAPFALGLADVGDHWLTTWSTIISQAPAVNPSTGKSYTWPASLTKILEFVWGPRGVNNTLDTAQTVLDNLDLYSRDADYIVGPSDSPTREIEIRVKRIWQLSKNDLVQQAELVLEYKRLAETFSTLEYETRDKSTRLGQLWDAREDNSKLETTEQARANFVMNKVVSSMNPEDMTPEKRRDEIKKFRREREFAFNIAMFVRLFGWGVVPLLARAPWRQV